MKKPVLKKYIITCSIALAIAAAVIIYEYASGICTGFSRLASDGCFVSGMLFLIIAVLSLVADGGGFYPFGYLKNRLQYTVTKNPVFLMSYTDYVLSRKKKGKTDLTNFFVVGGVLTAASFLFAFI